MPTENHRLTPEARNITLYPHKVGLKSLCHYLPNEEGYRKLKGENLCSGDRGPKRSADSRRERKAFHSASADLEASN